MNGTTFQTTAQTVPLRAQLSLCPSNSLRTHTYTDERVGAERLTCTSTEASGWTATVTAKASAVPGSRALAFSPLMLTMAMSDGAKVWPAVVGAAGVVEVVGGCVEVVLVVPVVVVLTEAVVVVVSSDCAQKCVVDCTCPSGSLCTFYAYICISIY